MFIIIGYKYKDIFFLLTYYKISSIKDYFLKCLIVI
ncbi:hypothetical protein C923_02853 [Plasmodium falciparum UGT5.1]|uniref:Uncharacterized protein n=1 Tax=Plasmodium falciparum UGT5.1 TaxID=1237627 RepID=W7JC87_PLAFA|nr:hypothetical protein C923_02853 [Plasmodium falciparum UGT5.1]